MGIFTLASLLISTASPLDSNAIVEPTIIEHRTVAVTQTVRLKDIPEGASQVRMWVPIPSDAPWQRVLDREIVSAPGQWSVVRQAEGRGDFVYLECDRPASGQAEVVVKYVVEREGLQFPLDSVKSVSQIQVEQFADDLSKSSPLMGVDSRIQRMADEACGEETDPARQTMILLKLVGDLADHYSKDPSKPHCGRGAAEDCLTNGGGCCTDLHSLFIALARARGIPSRMQYGYRMLDSKAGSEYDPGYRCWVEAFIPGAGWVPTDIVAADGAKENVQAKWGALSATRVWLWQGRSFELTPKAHTDRIDTMICGWAEIDGRPVDVLPAADGSPSKLTRTVQFEVLKTDRTPQTVLIAE